jgi:hypothetical protein
LLTGRCGEPDAGGMNFMMRGIWRRISDPSARPARVSALLICIVAMSLADLYMTLTHLMHFGMIEMNPLARRLITSGSPAELVIWKLATVLLTVAVLFLARRRRLAEAAAMLCCIGLAALTVHWINYNELISQLTSELHALIGSGEKRWVSFVPGMGGE